jgi:hypothetical protein
MTLHPHPERGNENRQIKDLSVALGDTLEFVLLLDGVRVGATLGSVDELFTIWGLVSAE